MRRAGAVDKPRLRRKQGGMSLTLIQVAIGGAIGAVLRYLTSVAALRLLGPAFPWGTLTVNVVGSFAMGLLAVWLSGGRMSPLLMTGVLGGFTTFSAFSLDAVRLFEKGQVGLAGAYVAASVVLSVAALVAGLAVARGFST